MTKVRSACALHTLAICAWCAARCHYLCDCPCEPFAALYDGGIQTHAHVTRDPLGKGGGGVADVCDVVEHHGDQLVANELAPVREGLGIGREGK